MNKVGHIGDILEIHEGANDKLSPPKCEVKTLRRRDETRKTYERRLRCSRLRAGVREGHRLCPGSLKRVSSQIRGPESYQ